MGGTNTSSDLMQRIEKAKIQPIGRTDVPPSLEAALRQAMSHRPDNRQGSVLEFVRELQQVESELGVAQTPLEVAVDDWALATVADLEDRTRVRGSEGVPVARSGGRQRRRRPVERFGAAGGLDVAVRNSAARTGGGAAGAASLSNAIPRSTGTRPEAHTPRRVQYLAWLLIAASVCVLVLGGIAALVLIRQGSSDLPRVSDISATTRGSSIEFSWANPGLQTDDTYVVTSGTDNKSTQQSNTFLAPVTPGQQVCITVTVNRAGKNGPQSAEKCASAKGSE